MVKGFDRMLHTLIFVALATMVTSRRFEKILRKIAGIFQDFELFISLCVARYIVWRETQRHRK
jgi:ABC-type polar amino acid transport system ATPase subunit